MAVVKEQIVIAATSHGISGIVGNGAGTQNSAGFFVAGDINATSAMNEKIIRFHTVNVFAAIFIFDFDDFITGNEYTGMLQFKQQSTVQHTAGTRAHPITKKEAFDAFCSAAEAECCYGK